MHGCGGLGRDNEGGGIDEMSSVSWSGGETRCGDGMAIIMIAQQMAGLFDRNFR
jgi:hypothetical protein